MQYVVIVENDESQWEDQTGVAYHFPKRYASLLTPGTQLIYYKGKMRRPEFAATRLSPDAHYFGTATAGSSYPDRSSSKGDLFVVIERYQPFVAAVPIRIDGEYLEDIPETRTSNYWRDGVRSISAKCYSRIVSKSQPAPEDAAAVSSMEPTINDLDLELTSGVEGEKYSRFTTLYERIPRLRKQAILIHGSTCLACGFDFGKVYGDIGAGFIHVHHTKPVSTLGGPQVVNPETDLVPVCANCHSIIHRRKSQTLTIDQLRKILNQHE